jgi:cystathionine beta-lyase
VISDEIHADLTYGSQQHVPFETLGDAEAARTVTVSSASKAFNLAGLRWAILHAGADAVHDELSALPAHYLGAPNVMAVEATSAAWSDGDEWLRAVMEVLDENRHALSGLLRDHFPEAVYRPPSATYLGWVDCSALGLGPDPAEVFKARGVALSSGPSFGPPGEGHVRLNFATSPSVLSATVSAMAES